MGTQKMSPLKKINPTGLSSFLILPLKKELIHNFLVLRHKKSNKHECFQCVPILRLEINNQEAREKKHWYKNIFNTRRWERERKKSAGQQMHWLTSGASTAKEATLGLRKGVHHERRKKNILKLTNFSKGRKCC